jgi:hypothetical protein
VRQRHRCWWRLSRSVPVMRRVTARARRRRGRRRRCGSPPRPLAAFPWPLNPRHGSASRIEHCGSGTDNEGSGQGGGGLFGDDGTVAGVEGITDFAPTGVPAQQGATRAAAPMPKDHGRTRTTRHPRHGHAPDDRARWAPSCESLTVSCALTPPIHRRDLLRRATGRYRYQDRQGCRTPAVTKRPDHLLIAPMLE